MRKTRIIKHSLIHLFLIALGISAIFPFIWMLSTSLKDTSLVFTYPPVLIPDPPMWSNYVEVWVMANMLRAMGNSLFISVISQGGNIIMSSMVAYAFAKIDFKFKNILFIMVLATVMIPFQVTLIPLFVIFRHLNWINTFYPLIVPPMFGTALCVFLMRQYFMRIPDAYRDSAYVDGCGHVRIWWKIFMPMSVPMIFSIGVLSFMWKWNEFLGPMLFLNSRELMTVPLVLNIFQTEHVVEWHLLTAASTIALAPIIILYLIAQRYVISGIMLGGIKG